MDINIVTDRIIIKNPATFNARQILDSGQAFRYRYVDNCYELVSLDKRCRIYSEGNSYIIETGDTEYFYNYFDLDTDYESIIASLSCDPLINNAIQYGRGIRILKQDPFETIINFIISANNNIPRIKGIIEKIAGMLGTYKDAYYAFPSIRQMVEAGREFFHNIGAGYRADYIYDTAYMICEGYDLSLINSMNTTDARKYLMKLPGVGPKVADCILLFSYYKTDVFPVDTWILKAYQDKFKQCLPRDEISMHLVHKYGELSGYAQQYLYYYKRNEKHIK